MHSNVELAEKAVWLTKILIRQKNLGIEDRLCHKCCRKPYKQTLAMSRKSALSDLQKQISANTSKHVKSEAFRAEHHQVHI